jgi:7-cyano-7-deazaguanine reductase
MIETPITPEQSTLGKSIPYNPNYDPNRLQPIARTTGRQAIGVTDPVPFHGTDYWHHYEVSWLNPKGKPIAALAEIAYDCTTPHIVEGKSMKLYFHSFNQTVFEDAEVVKQTAEQDIARCVGGPVAVTLAPVHHRDSHPSFIPFEGICIDELDIDCHTYSVDPSSLTVGNEIVKEALYSHLFKSNCLVTGQPDWASIQLIYEGKKINRAGLLQYLVSFRNHNEFSEQCVERLFMDIMQHCKPLNLTIYGRYTIRGGIAINPYRTTQKKV